MYATDSHEMNNCSWYLLVFIWSSFFGSFIILMHDLSWGRSRKKPTMYQQNVGRQNGKEEKKKTLKYENENEQHRE